MDGKHPSSEPWNAARRCRHRRCETNRATDPVHRDLGSGRKRLPRSAYNAQRRVVDSEGSIRPVIPKRRDRASESAFAVKAVGPPQNARTHFIVISAARRCFAAQQATPFDRKTANQNCTTIRDGAVGASAIACVIFVRRICSQLIQWFRQAASRLQHEAIARNPRQDRRVPGAETQSRDGRVAQLAEQLTLNQ